MNPWLLVVAVVAVVTVESGPDYPNSVCRICADGSLGRASQFLCLNSTINLCTYAE